MSFEYVLFHVGKAIPTIALFAAVSAIGYKIRETKGLAVATGVLAAIVGFGMLTQAFGSSQTRENAAIALGATAISTTVAFILVYKMLQFLRQDPNDYGRVVVLVGMVAAAVTGTLVSVCAAALMVGLPIFYNSGVDSLIWSSLLLVGIAGAISEYRAVMRKEAKTAENSESVAREPPRHPEARKPAAKWKIIRPE